MTNDKTLKITNREVGNLIEKIGRVQRNIQLFTKNNDNERLEIANKVAIEIHEILCKISD